MPGTASSISRARALAKVTAAYAWAFVAAGACLWALKTLGWASEPWRLAVADVVGTVVVFGFSVRWDNSSVYDPYWSVLPIGLVGYLAWIGAGSGANVARGVVVAGLIVLWGVRLTHNWARGWRGFEQEDWRYRDIRARTGRLYWPASLLGIHLFPTALVFLGCLPVVAIFTEPGAPLGWLDGVALIVTAAAIVIEGVADNTLRAHVVLRHQGPRETLTEGTLTEGTLTEGTLTEGIWGWSRHPNYFGELSFWWGLWLFGVAAVGVRPWDLAGALAMTALFNFVSIPMIERRKRTRRPDYASVEARVSRLIPWFPKP